MIFEHQKSILVTCQSRGILSTFCRKFVSCECILSQVLTFSSKFGAQNCIFRWIRQLVPTILVNCCECATYQMWVLYVLMFLEKHLDCKLSLGAVLSVFSTGFSVWNAVSGVRTIPSRSRIEETIAWYSVCTVTGWCRSATSMRSIVLSAFART